MKKFIILFAAMIHLNAMLAIEDDGVEGPAKIAISVNGLVGPRCIVEAESNWTIRQVTQAACHKLGVPWIKGNLLLDTDRLEQQIVVGTIAPEGTHTLTLTLLVSEPTAEEIKERIMDNLELLGREFASQGSIFMIAGENHVLLSVERQRGRADFSIDRIKSLKVTDKNDEFSFHLSALLNPEQTMKAMPAIIDLFNEFHRIKGTEIEPEELEALQAAMNEKLFGGSYMIGNDFHAESDYGTTFLVGKSDNTQYTSTQFYSETHREIRASVIYQRTKAFLILETLPQIAKIINPQIAE